MSAPIGVRCIKCGSDDWYPLQNNGRRCAVCLRARVSERHAAARARVLAAYGGVCVCCGETDQAFLVVDHINGGGTQHRRRVGIGNFFRWLIKNGFPPGIQVLCANCNMAKERPDGCPNQRTPAEISKAEVTPTRKGSVS